MAQRIKYHKNGRALAELGLLFGIMGVFYFRLPLWAQDVLVEKPSKEELISLDLKNVDIRELVKILSIKSGLTIMPSKEVKGRISIYLKNVTFDDALDIVLLSQDLAYDRKDNIITIMSAAEYESLFGVKFNEKRKFKTFKLCYAKPDNVLAVLNELKSTIGKVMTDASSGTFIVIDTPEKLSMMEQTIRELDQPLETVVFDLNYAKPADVLNYLGNFTTPNVGRVVIDERTSKVVVTDLSERLGMIRRLVSAFDEGSRQVAIEAKIIEVTLSERYQSGIDWDVLKDPQTKGEFSVDISKYGQISVGSIAEDDYTAVLQFLETFGATRIVSQPHIVAVNNQEAKILLGTREAYVSQAQSQAESTTVTSENVEFIDVGVKLNVTPSINKEGFITMKIKPEVSSVKSTLTTAMGSKIPIIDTSEAETMVKIKDGVTLMIAGLLKNQTNEDRQGIPILSEIPVIRMFVGGRDTYRPKKTEFVVFLTPRIIHGALQELETAKSAPGVSEPSQKEEPYAANAENKEEDKKETGAIWAKIKGLKEY